jgi:hypothetical protein
MADRTRRVAELANRWRDERCHTLLNAVESGARAQSLSLVIACPIRQPPSRRRYSCTPKFHGIRDNARRGLRNIFSSYLTNKEVLYESAASPVRKVVRERGRGSS